MLIAIVIAEKIRGLQRIGRFCKFWASEFSLTKGFRTSMQFCNGDGNEQWASIGHFVFLFFRNQISDITAREVPSWQIQELLPRATFQLLFPLFFLKISLLEMLIAVGNEHPKISSKYCLCLRPLHGELELLSKLAKLGDAIASHLKLSLTSLWVKATNGV